MITKTVSTPAFEVIYYKINAFNTIYCSEYICIPEAAAYRMV